MLLLLATSCPQLVGVASICSSSAVSTISHRTMAQLLILDAPGRFGKQMSQWHGRPLAVFRSVACEAATLSVCATELHHDAHFSFSPLYRTGAANKATPGPVQQHIHLADLKREGGSLCKFAATAGHLPLFSSVDLHLSSNEQL
jgi:hypothetical protein